MIVTPLFSLLLFAVVLAAAVWVIVRVTGNLEEAPATVKLDDDNRNQGYPPESFKEEFAIDKEEELIEQIVDTEVAQELTPLNSKDIQSTMSELQTAQQQSGESGRQTQRQSQEQSQQSKQQ